MRQPCFVRLFRQLRLAQLDQGVHQRFIALGPYLEQAFIDRAAVAVGGLENLASTLSFNRFAQALPGKDHLLLIGEPDILANAGIGTVWPTFKDEKPTVYLRFAHRSRQAGTQGEVVRNPICGPATKFDPGVANASLIGTHQQVPGHFFAVVTIGLNARWPQLGIEQERQGERKHLGLACSVVASQEQMAIPEPEFLAVVVKEFAQPQPQRLPALSLRLGKGWATRRWWGEEGVGHSSNSASGRPGRDVGGRTWVSPSANLAIAG